MLPMTAAQTPIVLIGSIVLQRVIPNQSDRQKTVTSGTNRRRVTSKATGESDVGTRASLPCPSGSATLLSRPSSLDLPSFPCLLNTKPSVSPLQGLHYCHSEAKNGRIGGGPDCSIGCLGKPDMHMSRLQLHDRGDLTFISFSMPRNSGGWMGSPQQGPGSSQKGSAGFERKLTHSFPPLANGDVKRSGSGR